MNINKSFILVQLLIFSYCLGEISDQQKARLLENFAEYFDNIPDQIYQCSELSLESAQNVNETTYYIVANLIVKDINNFDINKSLKCSATIQDAGYKVTVDSYNCQESEQKSPAETGPKEKAPDAQVEVTEPPAQRAPVQLDNEVQSDTAITSGEQFIAIPRDQPSAPCVGCASHVNPQAAGVSDLANLGVRHLDVHEPAVKHSLASVIDVQRQVQVVNGVRYILTLSVNYNTCTETVSENCAFSKICKVTVLVKPWVKLPNGANYRAILANNCTDEWQYGDNGEVLPELTGDNPSHNQGNGSVDPDHGHTSDDDIEVKHNTNLQSQPHIERTLTDEELKTLQEQIIPNNPLLETAEPDRRSSATDIPDLSKQHVFKVESTKQSENSIPVTESEKFEQQTISINPEKKKAIDEMLDFFDFSGFKLKTNTEDVLSRVRRNYDYDLQVLSLAENFHGIKSSIENARFMYEMAQAMVDYLNEMDMDVKNRVVKNVIKAEEETENNKRFIYIQARVNIPCDKLECEQKDAITQICNGVIDGTNVNSPQIINSFCYNDDKERDYRNIIKEVSLDDPVLQKLAEEAVQKIEAESNSKYALRLNKIASAITQITSGTLTKFSILVENIKCNKSVPLALRDNCTLLEQLGSKICEIIVHERHWLNEKKMTYSCTDRPVDMRISKAKSSVKNVRVDDPEIIDMLQTAIQDLETQSGKDNKLKIVNIGSITSQIVAGFLTKIEFVVGYTNCTDENYSKNEVIKCELLENEGLRSCKAQIWDRSWIMDGRQVEVSCDDGSKSNDIDSMRKKRSIDVTVPQEQRSESTDLKYRALANECLIKFMRSSSSHQHYEIVEIDKVTVQAVAGKLIKLDFSISPTNCFIDNDNFSSSSECNVVNPKNISHCRAKILDNVWMGKKQYFVNCNIKQSKKLQSDIQGLRERNPSDMKYYQLAEESLSKYLGDSGNKNHSIVRVQKVTTQIVSGLLTKIDFLITPQNQSGNNGKIISCHSDILEKHWLGTRDLNVSCDMKQKVQINNSREQSLDNPKYMQIAVESLQKYIKDNPESRLVRVTFVDNVQQIREITKIRFLASHAEDDDGDTLCNAEYSESISSKTDMQVKCFSIGVVHKKMEVTPGDKNYYKYVELADEAFYNHLQNISQHYTIVSVDSVTVQWDDGFKTAINFVISPIGLESSELYGQQCLAIVREKSWIHEKTFDVKCELQKDLYRTKRQDSHSRVRRQLHGRFGGLIPQDPNDPKYKVLAVESLRKYRINSGIAEPLEVLRVVKVNTQVVSGSLTHIYFEASGTSVSSTLNCYSKIWEQPWLNSKKIDVTCQNVDQRGKRELVGGLRDQDPSDPKYKVFAEESLQKFIDESGIRDPLTVQRVVKVTTQVVSGVLTRVDFEVYGSSDSSIMLCHSKVWEQPWMNHKQIDVTCQNVGQRGKRELVGGLQEQDPSDPKYKVFAEESLQKFIDESGIRDPLTVQRVVKVTTQVVSGVLTRVDFEVYGSSDSSIMLCHSKVWEQPWMNHKQIDVTCQNVGQRAKRELVGGLQEQDPSDPKYKVFAEESLQKFIDESGIRDPLTVQRVVKVTTQVVSGVLTRVDFEVYGSSDSSIMLCHSKVWEQPWMNHKQIDVTCQNVGQRGKRELVGGLQEQDPSDPKYKVFAEESLQKFIDESGIRDPLTVQRVVKVTTQVVSGVLTRVDFEVYGSSDSSIMLCHSKVWEQPWMNHKQIDVTCQNVGQRGKRELVGGLQEQDPSDPKYKVFAEESLQKFIDESGIRDPLTVQRVVKVTTQVVSGVLTRVDFEVYESSDSSIMLCHSKVWEQPWMNHKQIDVTCQNVGQRGKRELVGGLQEQDPSDPKYKVFAEESLQKFIDESGIRDPLTVQRVVKVTTQVVSGVLTRVDFEVYGSSDSSIMLCHSKIWEQPWMNNKQIDVTCQNVGQRDKRELIGGLRDQDPSDPKYKVFAEESLQKFIDESGIRDPLTVQRVVKVTTQVVSGVLTRVDFEVYGSSDSSIMLCHSKVWEQPWMNHKQIDVTCQNVGQRGKRELVGGLQEQDPSDPKYKVFAEESLQKFIDESGIRDPLTVQRVVKVTTQVVSGVLTRVDFEVYGSSDSSIMLCHSKVWEQPWMNHKQIDVTCQNVGQRGKRELVGGLHEQDPSDPNYQLLAEESLQKFIDDSGIRDPLTVQRVVKVTTQVVSGVLTSVDFEVYGSSDSSIMLCHSKVWDQPWMNHKQIDVTCQNVGQRGKRQIPGGLKDQDPHDPKYKVLAVESLQKYVDDSGIRNTLRVLRVMKVTTQVVSGELTRVDFEVYGSSDSSIMLCHSKVWEQPWMNHKQIDVTCQNVGQRGKRELVGGLHEQDPSDPNYQLLAEESLQKFIDDSGIRDPLTVQRVVKVTTQVVSGVLTSVDFEVYGSSDSSIMLCHSKVWDQPWMNHKQIDVTCQNVGQRGKRQIPGGLKDQDPHDPKYKVLAVESLQKYVDDSGIRNTLRVLRVMKVTTQVVSGELTRIDFEVYGSSDSSLMVCHSKVWEQPWLNNKQIDVTCQNVGHRAKRELAGGLQDQDPSDPKYKVLADESLQKYVIDSGIRDPLTVLRVVKVTTQVVSGMVTRIDFEVSGSSDSRIVVCQSKVWEQSWLKKKDISVSCLTNKRFKRDLGVNGNDFFSKSLDMHRGLAKESVQKNNSRNSQEHTSVSRGQVEEEQDPTKPEYKLLAEESLRKYQKKSTVYHKVIEVKRVATRVVSGLKYQIDFTAAPTACSVNVSTIRARSCIPDDDDILYCHTDIWNRPWLRKKSIDIKCYGATYDKEDFAEYESDDIDISFKPSNNKTNNDDKFMKLAKEASEKYLTMSNRKYAHNVTEILSASEQVMDGTVINIDFTLSPLTCLRNESTSASCKLKEPLIVFHCNTYVRIRPWLKVGETEIQVTCKKMNDQKVKKHKRDLGVRKSRQIGDEVDEMDDDTVYYYADRSVQYINDRSNSNNLHKLISIHAVQNSVQMGTVTVQMYIEVAETFCLRHHKSKDLRQCQEMNGLNHKLCFARLWPSPDDELVIRHVTVVCDDEQDFTSITGINIPELVKMSIATLERAPEHIYKLVHQGEPQIIPSLDSKIPFKVNFVIGTTNCSKHVNLDKDPFQCYLNSEIPSKACHSFIWLKTETKFVRYINAKCTPLNRYRRSSLDPANVTRDNLDIKNMVTSALEKLEMQSLHRYKQRVLQINSHSTKITSGKVTTIDFDVGYTSCLKYEWVANITSCDFLEHLPRRRCVAQIWERLWIENGQNIDVNCVDDETPLESHIEFESAEMANELAREALKHIEAKYPHPSKQKVVRIFSLEKQVVAGIHYKMKVEVGFTDCFALSDQTDCKFLKNHGLNKFCRVNVWVRPWTDHPPNFRVSCDFQEGTTHDLYHHVQAEHLFYNFLTTYSPSYVNNYSQMQKRFEIFKENVKKIHELNIHEKGTAVYGVTRFTDLTYAEFSSTYMGLKTNQSNENQIPMKKADIPNIKVPENFDWREYDAVTEVKDQGSCGSCWAFSVTGNIEGQWKMQSGKLVSLSEQELVDCDKLDDGCNGGLPDNAYRAIEQMGGLELESDYPYEGADEKCVFNKTLAKVQISGAVNITSNETAMAQWLVHNGPISIGINANAMQFYMGGISHPWKMLCNPTNLDHGVLIVGYGIKEYPLFHKQLPYWIVKNSWGKSWGEQGYYRVYRGDGTCGVNQMASSAVV